MPTISNAPDGEKVTLTGNERLVIDDVNDNPLTPDKYIQVSALDQVVDANANVVANNAKVSAGGSIDTHSDVDTTSSLPIIGEFLGWDGANWVPSPGGGGGGVTIPANIIYVAENGDDLTGTISDPELPYATLKEAILQIPANTEGYLVYIYTGVYDQVCDFDGTIDGVDKIVNIYFENGVVFSNTDGLSTTTLQLLNTLKLSITGYAEIIASVNNASHTAVDIDEFNLCEFKSISGTCPTLLRTQSTSEGLFKCEEINSTYTGAISTVNISGNGDFKFGQVKATLAASGQAVECLGTGFPVVNVGSVSSNVDGVKLSQESNFVFGKITATGKGLFSGSGVINAIVKGGFIDSVGISLSGSFSDSHFSIDRMDASGAACIDMTEMNRCFVSFDYAESTSGQGLVVNLTNRDAHIKGKRLVGSTFGVDMTATTQVITGSHKIEVMEIKGGTHGVRINQGAVSRINLRPEFNNCKIESTGAGANDFAIDINWIALSAGTGFLKIKDCELIVNGATVSVRNDGGVNFDIEGYNVHSATAIDATNITLTTITEIL